MKNHQDAFDELMRAGLSSLPPQTATDAGWERLHTALNHPEDALLRGALSSLPAAAVTGWDALEAKLPTRSPADIDLADKLATLQPTLTAGSWEALADRLEVETEAAVDEIVGDTLRTATTVGAPTGWAALAARLELIRERRHYVVATKLTELCLLTSLVLLFLRFAPLSPYAPPVATQITPADPITAAAEEQPTTPEIAAIDSAPQDVASVTTPTRSVPYVPARVAGVTPTFVLSISERDVQLPPVVLPALTRKAPLVAPLALLPLRRDVRRPHPSLRMPPLEGSERPLRTYLDVFVSPFDVNHVITKRDEPTTELEVDEGNRLVQGASVGALIGLTRGHSGVQFGLIYSETSYIPSSLIEVSGLPPGPIQPVKGYSRFRFGFLNLPISYNQVLRENDHWRLSAMATATVSINIASEFINEDPDLVASVQRWEERQAANNAINRSNPYARKDFTDPSPGWFQGGSLFDNTNLYLGGGLMVERLISNRSSIFLSPSIRRAVYFKNQEQGKKEAPGIGPYNDRIHGGQLRFGLRHLLSSK